MAKRGYRRTRLGMDGERAGRAMGLGWAGERGLAVRKSKRKKNKVELNTKT